MAALLLSLLFFGVVALVYIYIVNHGGRHLWRHCLSVRLSAVVLIQICIVNHGGRQLRQQVAVLFLVR